MVMVPRHGMYGAMAAAVVMVEVVAEVADVEGVDRGIEAAMGLPLLALVTMTLVLS